jgi:hypothetical protein
MAPAIPNDSNQGGWRDWTVFLFAHTISEVLDLAAFVVIFASVTRRVTAATAVSR